MAYSIALQMHNTEVADRVRKKFPVNFMNLHEYNFVIGKLFTFFREKLGFKLAATQQRPSILAACEDIFNVMVHIFGGRVLPLHQSGQMWLEFELLAQPDLPGCFCITTSYRDEPAYRREEGRHDLIFQMFEFETHGDMTRLIALLQDMLEFLGFPKKEDLKLIYPSIRYRDAMKFLGLKIGEEITSKHEEELQKIYGEVYLLTYFPEFTEPFWNMKRDGDVAKKTDTILCGMESIGSAERSVDPEEMRDRFYGIKNGLYAQELERRFGKKETHEELEDFLSFDFFPRCGGGIGLNRLIRAMKICGLMPDFS